MDEGLGNSGSGDEAPENLNVDAPAFVPSSPGSRVSSTSEQSSPSGGSVSDASRQYSPLGHYGMGDARGGLHVDVPMSPMTNEVLRILDHVPFTPSQGVRTPSPRNKAALRPREWTESGPSRFASSPRVQKDPSQFSPKPTNRALQFEQPGIPPFPNLYQSQPAGAEFGGMPAPQLANDHIVHGQMMQQMVFGFSGSPDSGSPTKGYMHYAAMPMGMHQGSPPHQVPPQAPPQMQMYPGQMYAAAGNPMPNLMAMPLPQPNAPAMQPDFQMNQAYNPMHAGAQPGPIPMVPIDPMTIPGAQMQPAPPPLPMGSNRPHNAMQFSSANKPFQGNSAYMPHHISMGQQQAGRMQGRQPRNLAHLQDGRKGQGSKNSSANSSANGSPVANQQQGLNDDQGKPRMNARQRRTLRRRREREIAAVKEYVAATCNGLDSSERSIFDAHLKEVETLMQAIQSGDFRDTGEGGAADVKISKLYEIAKMPMPAAAEDASDMEPSKKPDQQQGPSTDDSRLPAENSHGKAAAADKATQLAAAFDKQITLDGVNESAPPDPKKDRSDCSPLQPSTPDQQPA